MRCDFRLQRPAVHYSQLARNDAARREPRECRETFFALVGDRTQKGIENSRICFAIV